MAGKRLRTATRRHDTIGDCRTVIDLATGNNNMRPLLREKPGDFLANTATGAADECHFSVQIKKFCCHYAGLPDQILRGTLAPLQLNFHAPSVPQLTTLEMTVASVLAKHPGQIQQRDQQ